jgi:glyoxylase-like metal-dependent hydrolase (beta-lactamase superfamily II)
LAAFVIPAAQAQVAAPQYQAITGLQQPAPRHPQSAGFRVVTVASPAPDAINMHIVETPRGLVLFDALRRSDQVSAIFRAIDRSGKPPLALFVTHAHTDHYGGIALLKAHYPRLRVFAAPAVIEAMRQDPNKDNQRRRALFGERFPTQAQIDAALPAHALTDGLAVEVDGLRIIPMIFGPSESPAATVYRLPQLGAAITGDLVNVLTVSAPVQSLANWLVQLERIERELAPTTLLHVGHGPSGPLRPLLGEQRAYLTLLRDKVRSALASGGKISDNERERIVADLQQSFPHYRGAAALPPEELMRASIGWVAAQMQK